MAFSLRDSNGNINRNVLIAGGGVAILGVFWFLSRSSSTSGTTANGQSSDITGLLGGLQDAINKLAGTPPPSSGGSGGTGYVGPPVSGGGSGSGGHGGGYVGPPVSNVPPTVGNGYVSNPTNRQSKVITASNTYPVAASLPTGHMSPATVIAAQAAANRLTQPGQTVISAQAAANQLAALQNAGKKAPVAQGGTGTAVSGSKAV